MNRELIRSAFPEIEEIENEDLEAMVIDVWATALEDSAFEELTTVPWWPPFEIELSGPPVTTVEHVRGVAKLAIVIADELVIMYDGGVDRDVVVAGALLHDISKLYELSGDGFTECQNLLPHPHYSVYVLASHGCSVHLQHIALSHSQNSNVDPATIEARIVEFADILAVEGMFWDRSGELPNF